MSTIDKPVYEILFRMECGYDLLRYFLKKNSLNFTEHKYKDYTDFKVYCPFLMTIAIVVRAATRLDNDVTFSAVRESKNHKEIGA